jgi:MerR family mercuric resistance operon transcriptional regulator
MALRRNAERGWLVNGYTIGELARATGVHIETIRYYQRVGLLPVPARAEGVARRYGPEAVERLMLIRRARRLTFSLAEVGRLIAVTEGGGSCADAKAIAAARLAEIEREVIALQGIVSELGGLVTQCETEGTSGCPIVRHLSRPGPAES